jgi:hypothetical protein
MNYMLKTRVINTKDFKNPLILTEQNISELNNAKKIKNIL